MAGMAAAIFLTPAFAQNLRMDTYCNPLNVDYTYTSDDGETATTKLAVVVR